MQKVYLLLRNNHESGPFSVDELLQHELKPSDLVWEEGRSAGWSYPYEIASLKPFLHLAAPPVQAEKEDKLHHSTQQESLSSDLDAPFASKSVTSKNVYVSLPHHHLQREESKNDHSEEETLEQKADAIRKRAFEALEHGSSTEFIAVNPEHRQFEKPYELETKFARTTDEVGEDYSAWLYTQQIEKKKKARKRKSFLMGVTMVFLIATGILLYRGVIVSNYQETVKTESIQDIKKDDVVKGKSQSHMNSEHLSLDSPAELKSDSINDASLAAGAIEKKKVQSKLSDSQSIHAQKTVAIVTNDASAADSNSRTQSLESVDSGQTNNEKTTDDIVAASQKKEKSGGKKFNFFGIFKAKDKTNKTENNEVRTGEAKTAQAPAKGSTRRKPESTITAANLSNFISVSSNAPAESWMMGVQGLKLTLTNKSNETVKTATVEVRYYNEDKDLLEKKIIYFNNISPKSSQTVAAPDHRLAERTDYQLISAVPKEDGYVKQ